MLCFQGGWTFSKMKVFVKCENQLTKWKSKRHKHRPCVTACVTCTHWHCSSLTWLSQQVISECLIHSSKAGTGHCMASLKRGMLRCFDMVVLQMLYHSSVSLISCPFLLSPAAPSLLLLLRSSSNSNNAQKASGIIFSLALLSTKITP